MTRRLFDLVRELRARLGLGRHDYARPEDVERLLESLPGVKVEPEDVPGALILMWGENDATILMPQDLEPAAYYEALLEEIGHYLLVSGAVANGHPRLARKLDGKEERVACAFKHVWKLYPALTTLDDREILERAACTPQELQTFRRLCLQL